MTKTIAPATKPAAASTTTKDSAKVRVGGSSIRFASTRDAGKVHVGGSSMRF